MRATKEMRLALVAQVEDVIQRELGDKLKPETRPLIAYSKIVPDELQAEFIQIATDTTNNSWKMGDLTNAVIDLNAHYGLIVNGQRVYAGAMECYAACGAYAGMASRTVREYAYVARRFDADLRAKYEILPFEFFRVAIRLGQNAEKALDWCMDELDQGHSLPSADSLQHHYGLNLLEDGRDAPAAKDLFIPQADEMGDAPKTMTQNAGEASRRAEIVDKGLAWVGKMAGWIAAGHLDVSQGDRDAAVKALQVLKRILEYNL